VKTARTRQQRRELALSLMRGGAPVSSGQAAELLGVDVTTVARWCREGTMGAWRTKGDRGHWRIPAAQVARRVLGEQGDDAGE
jgi:excisionase family DNA binding protein